MGPRQENDRVPGVDPHDGRADEHHGEIDVADG
jgi:hypothetical protein